jgi:two-component system nitrogen regulation sensor histidine kinase GlnL
LPRDLRHVLDAILAGVIVLDAEGAVEELNAAACRILRVSPESTTGRPVEELLGAEHALACMGRHTLATGASASESETRVERPRVPALHVDLASSPLFDAAGRIDGAVLVLRDRTLQRRLEQLEFERERHESFGRIAAGIAHEIKNPLAGIRGAAELLGRRSDDDKTRETAELVVRESSRIASLVDDFMVFARGEDLKHEPTNLHEVLDGVLDLLAFDPVSAGVELERVYDPSIPEVLADADRLTQVFLNLARNALQAMSPAGGRLTIMTRTSLDRRFAVGAGRSVPGVEVSFRDTGPGMSDAVLREARTPFFTTRSGGTGLGLAVAEYWTSRHDGAVEIESRPGEGTCVRVRLPLRRPR